jgi:AcrR family transcriptional regulator
MGDQGGIDGGTDAKPTGRRAANKADKLRRITQATRELFIEKGFDGTTMRDIAARAGVGFGTLFDYAASKRDFLFLLFNPALESVLDESAAAAVSEPLFLDKLMAYFGGYYALYARDRAIARAVLRELTFFSEGGEAEKFLGHRARFLALIIDHVNAAMVAGELRDGEAEPVARVIFAIYAWEVRRWLAADAPSVARGLSDLRELLILQINGFAR